MHSPLSGILLTVLISAFFAGAETAFLSFSHLLLPGFRAGTNIAARSVYYLAVHPERFMVTTLTGNNIAAVLYSSLMAVYLTRLGVSEGVIIVVTPVILLIFGETLPKSIARRHANRLIKPVGLALAVLRLAAWPLVRTIEFIIGAIYRAFKLTSAELDFVLSHREIGEVLVEAGRAGEVSMASLSLIRGIASIGSRLVADIMTPRTEVHRIDIEAPVSEARSVMRRSGFSRLPCYENDSDNIIGYVSARALLATPATLRDVLIPLSAVPEGISVLQLLRLFRREQSEYASVIDEYGEFAGVVSSEDLVEELVGPIQDEYDPTSAGIWRITDDSWVLKGNARLSHLVSQIGFVHPEVHSRSIGGLITELTGDIPKAGFKLELPGFSLEVLNADQRGVRLIRFYVRTGSDESGAA